MTPEYGIQQTWTLRFSMFVVTITRSDPIQARWLDPRSSNDVSPADVDARKMWRLLRRRNTRSSSNRDEAGRSYRELYREAQRVIEQQRAENEQYRVQYEELKGLRTGTYYATIDQIWVGEEEEFGHEESYFTDLVRGSVPTFVARSTGAARAGGGDVVDSISANGNTDGPNGGDLKIEANNRAVYEWTKECAEDEDTYEAAAAAASDSSSADTSSTHESSMIRHDLDLWPVDIFGNGGMDATNQMAHLVPATSDAATLYRDVAICALGLRVDAGWNITQKAIHGARNRAIDDTIETGGASGTDPNVSTKSASHRTLLPRTGIKHFVTNRLRLSCHEYFLDNAPCVLVVPILSLDQMKSWNGEGYRAVVMVGPWEWNSVQAICRAIGMQDKKEPFANACEVKTARLLLEHVIKGMAYSLLERLPSAFTDHLNAAQKARLDELRAAFANLRGRRLVVPKVKEDRGEDQAQPPRVRMVEFASASGASSISGRHPAPDPLLLAVRAAVNWSARHNQRLKPASDPKEDDTEDEADRLAEQEFLEWREEELEKEERMWRNPTVEELARRLGQPNGYQEGHDNCGASPSTARRPKKRWEFELKARRRQAAT